MSVTPVEIQRWVSYKGQKLHPRSVAFCIFLFHSSHHISSMSPVFRQWTHDTLLLYLHYGKQTFWRKYPSKYGDKWEWRNRRFCALCAILQFISLTAFSANADRQTNKQTHTHTHTHTHNISRIYIRKRCEDICRVCATDDHLSFRDSNYVLYYCNQQQIWKSLFWMCFGRVRKIEKSD
jgi:hypothetical protein